MTSQSSIPRLKDVANAANVSLSAASRILRGQHGRFGKETCQRVIDSAQTLGWRPNLLVNGMQTGQTKTIGVLIPPYDSFWVGVLSGIHEVLSKADYLPITVWVGDATAFPTLKNDPSVPNDPGLAQINRLMDRRVDALILWPPIGVAYYDHFLEIERQIPVAVIDHEYSANRIADSIETDEQQAAQVVADHLLHLGHKRIACISTAEAKWQSWAVRRRNYFEKSLHRNPEVDYHFYNVAGDVDEATEVSKRMLLEHQPTAVFAISDHEAIPVYRAAKELGIDVPSQLSVIGFADLDFASSLSPPLTTMRQKPKIVGKQAARLVVDRLEGKITETDSRTVHVPAELMIRNSTAEARRQAR